MSTVDIILFALLLYMGYRIERMERDIHSIADVVFPKNKLEDSDNV